jgi:hypothetical protein
MTTRARLAAAAAAGVLVVAGAVPVLAATRHGITPVSPKPGATVPAGANPTFKVRAHGKGPVWVYVCRSPHRRKYGVICDHVPIRAKRQGRYYVAHASYFAPLVHAGTYYWQAHRIRCEHGTGDCLQEGPVSKLVVG